MFRILAIEEEPVHTPTNGAVQRMSPTSRLMLGCVIKAGAGFPSRIEITPERWGDNDDVEAFDLSRKASVRSASYRRYGKRRFWGTGSRRLRSAVAPEGS